MRQGSESAQDKSDRTFEHVDDLPSRATIIETLESLGKPSGMRALANALKVTGKPALNALKRRVNAMQRDGQLVIVRGRRLAIPKRLDLIDGHIVAHRDGYAFVQPDGGGDDIYLAPREAHQAFHGDRVLVRIAGHDRRNRPYGNLVEIVERANLTLVGRYQVEGGVAFVEPDSPNIHQDILIPAGAESDAEPGQVVLVTVEQQPKRRSPAVGRVVEVLGDHLAAGMEIEIATRKFHLPTDWSASVESQIADYSEQTIADAGKRRDLTRLPLVTIDGEDARDFDDAVHARQTDDGFVLTVAIADVAHYVTSGTPLDLEAFERGTSVYFPNRVIPMLPEVLSNNLCSLVPGENRLALVCEIKLSADGEVQNSRFFEAVIRSHQRLVYEQVQAAQDGDADARSELTPEVLENVSTLYKLFWLLDEKRRARGALEIETAEAVFSFDDNRKIEAIASRSRVDAHRVIEVCMITANVAAAEFLLQHESPALFRVHDEPDAEKIEALRDTLNQLGLDFPVADEVHIRDFYAVLEQARERDDHHLVETLILRSQKLAQYSETNRGHFGLGLEAYAHFTSPIRRYPDLFVHRQVKRILRREALEISVETTELANQCSRTERRAEEASRDVVKWLKCEFMQDKIGQQYSATITGVAEFGVFAELDDVFVEGLLHVSELPGDYYRFNAARHQLKGEGGGVQYRLGNRIEVVVARVDLDERRIDFALPKATSKTRSKRRRRG